MSNQSPRLNVCEIFQSIDGEFNGFKGAGELATFIRLTGCNLQCRWCDTAYAQTDESAESMTIGQIVRKIPGHTKVTITGGEPLTQLKGLEDLVNRLLDKYCHISIETNGSIEIPRSLLHSAVRIVADYKLPSSGMEQYMSIYGGPLTFLRDCDVIKFVINGTAEYEYAKKIVKKIRVQYGKFHAVLAPQMVFSPTIKDQKDYMGWPATLAELMIADQLDSIQYSLQIHKVLWPYATKER